jgi:hypothetical protein
LGVSTKIGKRKGERAEAPSSLKEYINGKQ